MARLAEYRDDISGLLATGGTSTAYTVTTNQVLASVPNDGQILAITPHATNGASPTLRADGGTIYAIQTSPGAAVAAGVLVAGTPYVLKFSLSATAWILHGFFANPFNVPLGVVLDYTGDTAPNSNFALANGQAISRTTYATYFALVGTRFGPGDGAATFNIPDLSNRIVAGTAMGGTSRITIAGGNFDGTVVGGAGGAQNRTLAIGEMPVHTPAGSVTGLTGTVSNVTATGSLSGILSVSITDPGHTHGGTIARITGGAFQIGAGANTTVGNTDAATTGISGSVNLAGGTFSGGTVSPTITGGSATFTGNSIGSGTAFSLLPPVMTLPKIVRIF